VRGKDEGKVAMRVEGIRNKSERTEGKSDCRSGEERRGGKRREEERRGDKKGEGMGAKKRVVSDRYVRVSFPDAEIQMWGHDEDGVGVCVECSAVQCSGVAGP
jgi:hypothetical protein